MKSNVTDLPSDAESVRRLMPEMLERAIQKHLDEYNHPKI